MTLPLTLTFPEVISSSAWRREETPAAAISFCSRCSIAKSKGRKPKRRRQRTVISCLRLSAYCLLFDTACQILKVFDTRQLRKVLQPKLDQKFLRRAVHHRPANSFFAAFRDYQTLVEQRLDGGRRLHPANLEDLGDGYRLAISDHRESFE